MKTSALAGTVFSQCTITWVFVTKLRHKVFSDRHLTRMEQIMRDVRTDVGAELVEFNGENNHVHLLVNYPPKVAAARLVHRPLIAPLAAGVPRPRTPLLPDQQALVGLILRRLPRRGTAKAS